MPEQDDRAAIEILKAPLSRAADRDQLKELQFRLMGFATGLALLVLLAPTWFVRDRGTSRIIDVYGGTSLFGFAPEKDASLGPLGVVARSATCFSSTARRPKNCGSQTTVLRT